jgi:hypothetical protein
MAILMREIQKVRPGKWAELEDTEAKWVSFERRVGFPENKRRYRVYSGVDDVNTLVVEFEFESLAALEAANERAEADPEYWQLLEELGPVVESVRVELCTVLD